MGNLCCNEKKVATSPNNTSSDNNVVSEQPNSQGLMEGIEMESVKRPRDDDNTGEPSGKSAKTEGDLANSKVPENKKGKKKRKQKQQEISKVIDQDQQNIRGQRDGHETEGQPASVGIGGAPVSPGREGQGTATEQEPKESAGKKDGIETKEPMESAGIDGTPVSPGREGQGVSKETDEMEQDQQNIREQKDGNKTEEQHSSVGIGRAPVSPGKEGQGPATEQEQKESAGKKDGNETKELTESPGMDETPVSPGREGSVVSLSKIDVGVCAPAPSEDKSKQEKHTNEKNPHFNEPNKQSNKQKKHDEKKTIIELKQKIQQEARAKQNLEKKLTELEASEKGLKDEIEIYKNDKMSLKSKLTNSEEKMDGMNSRFKEELTYRDNQIAKLNAELTSIASEKDNLLTRLSALAGAKLLDNNPNIADLSDANRPTKLAEHYSELYDNEWTDAFTVLQNDGLDDMQCIGVLLNTLTTTYKMCEEKAEAQNTGLHSSVSEFLKGDGLPPEMNKHFKESRKKNYNKYIPELTQDMESKLTTVTNMTRQRVKLTVSYHKKCLEICWLMCIQDPPVYLDCQTQLRGKLFIKGTYKEYTKSGPFIDYIVWPPVYLHKGGPMLSKGTAQCARSKDDLIMNPPLSPVRQTKGAVTLTYGTKLSQLMNNELKSKDRRVTKSANYSHMETPVILNEKPQIQTSTIQEGPMESSVQSGDEGNLKGEEQTRNKMHEKNQELPTTSETTGTRQTETIKPVSGSSEHVRSVEKQGPQGHKNPGKEKSIIQVTTKL